MSETSEIDPITQELPAIHSADKASDFEDDPEEAATPTVLARWLYKVRAWLWLTGFLVCLLVLTWFLNGSHGTLVMNKEGAVVFHAPPPWIAFLREAVVAVALACLLALLSETPIFKNYLQTRFATMLKKSDDRLLARFNLQARNHLIERLSEPSFARALHPEVLDQVEMNIIEARFPTQSQRPMRDLYGTLARERQKHEYWREDLKAELTYTVDSNRKGVYTLRHKKRYTLKSALTADLFVPISFGNIHDPIEGLTDEEVYREHDLRIGGQSVLGNLPPMETRLVRNRIGKQRRHSVLLRPGESVLVEEDSTTIYRDTVPFTATMIVPTFRWEMTISHELGLDPILYVHGLTVPAEASSLVEPENVSAQFRNWRRDQWLMPKVGFSMLLINS